MKQQPGVFLMAGLYILAGLNHFVNPDFYHNIIPPYLGDKVIINIVSGIAEITMGSLLLPKPTRKWAGYGIILMLLAFVPAHVYMLQKEMPVNGQNVPRWILWSRLLFLQPLLIWWAFRVSQKK